jgi:hypothetical protein
MKSSNFGGDRTSSCKKNVRILRDIFPLKHNILIVKEIYTHDTARPLCLWISVPNCIEHLAFDYTIRRLGLWFRSFLLNKCFVLSDLLICPNLKYTNKPQCTLNI